MTAMATIFSVTSLGQHAAAADLRMSWWGGDSRHVATQAALEACGAKYGHTIAPEFTGFDGHLQKLTTQLAGSTEADIMQVNWPWLPLFSKDGSGFADLTTLDAIDLSQWSPAMLETATLNGHLNGLPVSTTGRVFMFNKQSFERAGLAVPSTWSELIAAAPAFKEKIGPDAYPFYAIGLNALLVVSMVAAQATGKDLVDPATNTVAWTPEELTAALEFYQGLVDQGVTPSWKDAAAAGTTELFELPAWSDGRIAGSYEWDSTYFKYSDPLAEGQELVPVPPLTIDGASNQGVYRKPSMVFAISAHSQNPEAAAQILNCLMNEPEGITPLADSRGLPASAVAATMLAESGAMNPTLIAANEIVMDADGPAVSPFNEHPEIRSIFQDTLELFAYGEISAEEAAGEIIEGINGVLAKL
jgi:oligogalacturonide transport system substrate-binding protein